MMLETMFDVLPEWAQKKVIIRIVYTVASYVTARAASFMMGPVLDHWWDWVVKGASTAGIPLTPNLLTGPVDTSKLQAVITGLLMIAMEFAINHLHETYVKPVVAPQTQGGQK